MEQVEPYTFAAQRDASHLDRPDTRTVRVWHVDRGNGTAACASATGWSSRCNPMLVDFTRKPVTEVAENVRCHRPGCRVHWPKSTSSQPTS